ncbi:MAG: SRPBCC family protein [Sphingobacteriales bacterium]|nr:MAG: SRPBCC family protein [Sphingobacteriales bacterium]
MPRFSESIHIACTPEAAFDLTQDYDQRLAWDTFLIEARLVGGATEAGAGIRSWCVAHNGMGMETEYVSFRRPKVAAVKMTRGPWLFSAFTGSWNFRAESGGTKVTFLYAYRLRFPASIGGFYVRRRLNREVRQRLADLKKRLERL